MLSGGAIHAQSNYALAFDGTDDYLSTNLSLNSCSRFTLETWVNYSVAANNTALMGQNGTLEISFNDSYLVARMQGQENGWITAVYPIDSDFPSLTWNHVAVTGDGSSLRIYINGMLKAQQNSSWNNLSGSAGSFHMAGYTQNSFSFFTGMIDEVRVWDRARTPLEIRANMYNKNLPNNAAGLLAYFRLNEGSETTVQNSSVNSPGLTGTLQNGTLWAASPVQYGANALQLDGTDDYVTVPHSVSSDFTLEYWMKTTATASAGTQWFQGQGIVDAEMPGATNDWGTSLLGGKLAFGIGQSGFDRTLQSVSDVNTGSWVHVAVSWKQSTGEMKLYINGIPEGTLSGSTNLRNAPNRITFGQLQTNINRFNGTLDEVRIWNGVRTAAEIMNNKNRELDPAVESNLLAYYTFNQGIASGNNTAISQLIDQKNSYNGSLNNFSLSGSSSNFVAQNGSFIPLPLQWGAFTVTRQPALVLLQWNTLQEENTAHFIIQHSGNGRDWTELGRVPAAGNSLATISYQFTDPRTTNGEHYYRIVQQDADGRLHYSAVRKILIAEKPRPFLVFSNPVQSGLLRLQVNEQLLFLTLYRADGSAVWQKPFKAGPAVIDLKNLAAGLYLLKGGGETERLLIQ